MQHVQEIAMHRNVQKASSGTGVEHGLMVSVFVAGIVQKRLAVRGLPYSAAPSELLAAFEIDAAAIVKAVKSMM